MLLLAIIAPFTVHSQNQAVKKVLAETNDNAVDLVWSFNDIVPESVLVDFETGDFSQADFVIDQTYPWEITENAYEGKYAIKSTCEGVDNGVSAFEITVDVPFDATMSFYHKVDCEYYFDNAYFYIDGVERDLITGNVDWTYREYKVSKGTHTYRWTYRKDSDDFESSADVYFVDNIVLYEKLDPFAGGWVHYDDGHFVQDVGSQSFNVDWGVCFPNTEEYAGYYLTKVATYDGVSPAKVKANIYFGGVDAPGTLVHSQEFNLKGSESMLEFELSTPLPIDGTEPLWITFHNECNENAYVYPATGCNYVGDPNTDWISWDKGANWEHLSESNVFLTWMVRGYLENSRGETALMSKERNAQKYNVYRKNNFTEEVKLIAENVTDTVYTDATWTETGFGIYTWGVEASYADGNAETTWSNVLSKDMYTAVNVNVTTNSSDVPTGARVKFVNLTEPGQGFDYKVTLDETGVCAFERFRKGNYKFTVTLEGYEKYEQEIEIVEAKDVTAVIEEIKATVENLYVSPTGWAMWENTSFDNGGGTFYFDFEDGTFDGWTTLDADGDGLTWRITTDIMGPGNGYNKSKYCVISQSYCVDSLTPETAALKPDNYMITTEKYLITEDSELSYYVCAQDQTSPAEHYAVMVSTTDTDTDSFVTVWEETLSRGASATRNSRAQGAWYKRVIDLKAFAGQEVYVAFRHFNTVGQFYIDVDNIALVNNAKSSSNTRSLNGYTVKLNDEVVANNVTTNYYQFEDLTAGQTYKATVIANYTTGESEASDYNWTYVSPSEYAGVKSIDGRNVAGKAFVEWTFEGDEETGEAETSFSFNFSDGTLNGWRSLDADGDGYGWYNSAEKLGPGYGYKDDYCVLSHSFYSYFTDNGNQFNFPLTPDNYLVTEKKYAITESSQLSFMVCALDPNFPEEHYGVAITMADDAAAEDFITIWEETIESNDPDLETPQTDWVLRTIDLSKYAGEEIYIAIRHFNCTDQYMINIDDISLTTGEKSSRNENDMLGVMVFCEDELLTPEPISKRSFYTEFPGYDEYTYCVRVVYNDYAMSESQCVLIDAPMQCVAPRNLYSELTVNENGEYGVSLQWPFEVSDWLSYDNNIASSGFSNGGSPFYWGILLPNDILADYAGTNVTKVKLYDYEAGSTTLLIYYGSKTAPMIQKHIQSVALSGTKQWIEVELEKTIPVTGEDHIWIMGYQSGTAILCEDSGNKSNGRWVSLNGTEWMDLKALNSAYNYVWALKAYVTSDVRTERGVETQEFELAINENVNDEVTIVPLDKTVATSTNESVFQHYNVYRGENLNEMELLAETVEGKYFDVLSYGTYYYQVRSVYKDGDETCESEPANSFQNPDQYYVKVELLNIGETGVNGMMVYPNPAKDNLTIKAEGMKRVTITNTLGQVVYDNDVNSDNEVINMSQYDAGIYMVRITTESGSVVRKVSKQ